jgi:hypothetical protein
VSCEAEFATVDLIIRSNAETRGVDAFALALLKAERQIRRLFIHLVYQFPCFGGERIGRLRDTLWANAMTQEVRHFITEVLRVR